ncbi:hypothetical protein BGZ80_005123 [Entomortierella chlamydospora]|uniref:C2H2-type domain-containing protein n=1 Tax=Entomortierella chlamydospora TaxID=101097 RepID=A0A9P6SVE3_9FUNG|nr:hypothetical protein BGZ80_005123 [Entomortierella chlamydospora]
MDLTSEIQQLLSSNASDEAFINPSSAAVLFPAFGELNDHPITQDAHNSGGADPEIGDLFGLEITQAHEFQYFNQEGELFSHGLLFGMPAPYSSTSALQQQLQQQQEWNYEDIHLNQSLFAPSTAFTWHEPLTSDFSVFRTQDSDDFPSPEGYALMPFADLNVTAMMNESSSFSQVGSQSLSPVAFSSTSPISSLNSSEPDEYESGINASKRKKRYRKKIDSDAKPKAPRLTFYCPEEGCNVTCSSEPSLARHVESHKWRGKYHPLRCEGCQSGLSNEYAVQRHITRSADTMPCRRMSVYSFMKSKTEVDITVRFNRDRPHGKKTVQVNLEEMKAMYLK